MIVRSVGSGADTSLIPIRCELVRGDCVGCLLSVCGQNRGRVQVLCVGDVYEVEVCNSWVSIWVGEPAEELWMWLIGESWSW